MGGDEKPFDGTLFEAMIVSLWLQKESDRLVLRFVNAYYPQTSLITRNAFAPRIFLTESIGIPSRSIRSVSRGR